MRRDRPTPAHEDPNEPAPGPSFETLLAEADGAGELPAALVERPWSEHDWAQAVTYHPAVLGAVVASMELSDEDAAAVGRQIATVLQGRLERREIYDERESSATLGRTLVDLANRTGALAGEVAALLDELVQIEEVYGSHNLVRVSALTGLARELTGLEGLTVEQVRLLGSMGEPSKATLLRLVSNPTVGEAAFRAALWALPVRMDADEAMEVGARAAEAGRAEVLKAMEGSGRGVFQDAARVWCSADRFRRFAEAEGSESPWLIDMVRARIEHGQVVDVPDAMLDAVAARTIEADWLDFEKVVTGFRQTRRRVLEGLLAHEDREIRLRAIAGANEERTAEGPDPTRPRR